MNKHQRALRAARAAKRIPIVGTAVIATPVLRSWVDAGMSAATIGRMDNWRIFFKELGRNFTGFADGALQADRLLETYLPIGAYILARKAGAGKVAGQFLKHLHLRF